MIAVSLGDEPIVRYLLEHGGNPNGKVFASDTTPLNIAIKKKNARLIKLLINAGAIVTSDEVTLAIDKGLDQETIECLLHHSVNSENLFSPYLISLISSLKALDQFYEGEFDAHLVSAASESGSIEMVRYLIEVKQIDFKGLVIQDMEKEDRYLAEQAGNPKFQYLLNSSRTCLSVAVRTNAAFVRFLFEDLNLRPSPIIIQELCGRHAFSFKVVAYLLSLLEQSFEKAQELLSIGLDHSLSLVCLFKLFNSALILQGNPHRSPLSGNGFIYEVAALIKEKAQGLDAASLLKLLHENPEATEGALFYYCSEEFAEQTEQFFFLLNEVMKQGLSLQTVDIQNINGESLAVFAYEQGCYCLVDKLLARGANPDLPDHEGRTLINRVLDHIFSDANQLKWVSGYAHDMTHSLRYASKAACSSQSQLEALLKLSGGQIHGLTINELLENSIALETHDGTGGRFTSLFVHLSEHNAQEMVRLLKDPAFLAQHFKIKKEAPRLLSILSAIDASRLPAADKARRLSPMDSCDRAYSEKSWSKMHSIFSPLESSDFSENEGLNVTHRI